MLQTPNEKEWLISGPQGQLQLAVSDASASRVAIMCHPHPLYGGTMNNKVVTTATRAWQNLGLTTVRFNFRGIDKSAGEYAHGMGESEDLKAVLQWVREQYYPEQIWLGGFSFGSYVALRVAAEEKFAYLLTIAPPVNHFRFTDLGNITYPWLLVQGDEDEVVSAEQVLQWAKQLAHPPHIVEVAKASHFFHGRLIELRQIIEEDGRKFLK